MESIELSAERRSRVRLAILGALVLGLFFTGSIRPQEAEAAVTSHYAEAECRIPGNTISPYTLRVNHAFYATRTGDTDWTWIRIWSRPDTGGQWTRVFDTGKWIKMTATAPGWNWFTHDLYGASHGFQYHVDVFHWLYSGSSPVKPMYYKHVLNGWAGTKYQSPGFCTF